MVTVSCSYIVGWTRLDMTLSSLAHYDTRRACAPRGPPPALPRHLTTRCSGELVPQVRLSDARRESSGGVDARSFFPWLRRSPVLHPYVQDPFPSKRSGILERDDLSLPVVPGGQDRIGILKPLSAASCAPGGCSKHPEGGGSPLGRATSEEWLGDWDGRFGGPRSPTRCGV